MDIILTGTGSPLPDPNRAGPSTLVKAGDTHILVDAGRGVVMRMAAAGSDPSLLAGVLITHLHSDHICALNDVITTHWVRTRELVPLNVFGPAGHRSSSSKRQTARAGSSTSGTGSRTTSRWYRRVPKVEVTELRARRRVPTSATYDVTTAATVHAPVHPTIGFRLEHEGATSPHWSGTRPRATASIELAADADVYVQTVLRRGHRCELLPGRDGCRTSSSTTRVWSRPRSRRPARAPSGWPLTHMVPGADPRASTRSGSPSGRGALRRRSHHRRRPDHHHHLTDQSCSTWGRTFWGRNCSCEDEYGRTH